MSRFTVANGMESQVREAFLKRPHLVDGAAGFLRMEVLNTKDAPEEFWLLTWWTDEASYRAWHKGHAYRDSHAGMPKGLKLVRGSAAVRFLDHVTD